MQTNRHKCQFTNVAWILSDGVKRTLVTLNSHLPFFSLEAFTLNIDYFQDSFHSQWLRFRLYEIERPQKSKASELPGVHPRRHGVIGCGGSLMTLVTPAHLRGCHGPATGTGTATTKQQHRSGNIYKVLELWKRT